MDELDGRIIDLLSINARESISSLAIATGVSRATVKERMRRLEESRTIVGYGVNLNKDLLARAIKAHVMISIDTAHGDRVVEQLKNLKLMRALYAVSGSFDLIAVLRGDTTEEVDQELDNIRKVKGVKETKSSILLSTKLEKH